MRSRSTRRRRPEAQLAAAGDHAVQSTPATTALQLQRAVGNRATAAVLSPARPLQRTKESEELLTQLATPRIRPGPAIEVQKSLVKKLDEDHKADFAGGLINLGGILIDEMPETDTALLRDAELVELPKGGGFISTGSPRGDKVVEHGLGGMVVANTLKTMIDAKQIEYLRKAGLPNQDWKILVEVHYFRERDMAATGFHKDTLGETLFVNLNYHMDKKVIGPEYVVNPPVSEQHDELLATRLPESFRKDLAVTRAKLGDPTEYGSGMVDPYGYVGFVDEAVHHATPFYGHRWVTGLHLKQYLQERYPAAYKEAATAFPKFMSSWDYYSGFQGWVDKSIISAADSKKWLAWMKIVTNQANDTRHLTRVDLKATMSEAEFDDVLEAVGAAEPAKRTMGAPAGFREASIPKAPQQPITPKNKRPLKRRLSQPDFRKLLPPEPIATEKRRFFRTWIRVISKTKADDLRRRLAANQD